MTAPVRPSRPQLPARRRAAALSRPSVVALGGGCGLSTTLSAIRTYAGDVTAAVTVADDGGSSGRLRGALGIPAPGDVRRCLVALSDDPAAWTALMEHRPATGRFAGHAAGNLMLAALTLRLGGFPAAVEAAASIMGCSGRVLPATDVPVDLLGDVGGRVVAGETALARSDGSIRRVRLEPDTPPTDERALGAIRAADQVVLAPGSLFTSLLAVLAVPAIRHAVNAARGEVIYVCNLEPQPGETDDDGHAHLSALLDHGVRVDTVLYDPRARVVVDPGSVDELDVRAVAGFVGAAGDRGRHDPVALAAALRSLCRSRHVGAAARLPCACAAAA